MKFDMGRAWNDAVALLRANGQVVAIVAGAFFFLPNVVVMMMLQGSLPAIEASVAGNPDPNAALQAFGAVYGEIWWQLILATVITSVGMLGLLTLLTHRGRPTVAEALKSGVVYFLPYLASQILLTMLILAIVMVPLLAAGLAGTAAGALLGIAAAVAVLYVYVKFSLTVPVIVIEHVANPVRALARSWELTKGNSVRLFLFYLLLFIALVVIALVFGLIVGLVGALAGASSGEFIGALANSAMNAAGITIYLAVLAAIHRQLTGRSTAAPSETFG
jgi:hypothetical protein